MSVVMARASGPNATRHEGSAHRADESHPCGESAPVVSLNLGRLARLGSQGVWAVSDQALFAGSNLLVNVLLARWLPGPEYGAFVTAYSVMVLAQIAHSALLIEPMLIFGADKHQASFSHYFTILLGYHWKLTLGISVCLAAAAAIIATTVDGLLGEALAGTAVISPFVFLSWLARRGCYGASIPKMATLGGAINLVVVLVGLLVLKQVHLLNVFSGQIIVGVAALAATAFLFPTLGRVTSMPVPPGPRSEVWSDHWRYARWSSASGACTWFYTFIYYLVLPKWHGLAASGSLKALLNLIMPILHSDGALITLLLPQFVRSRRVPGRFVRIVSATAAAFLCEAALYWLMLLFVGQRLVGLLYGTTFHFDRSVVLLIGAIPPLTSLVNILSNALRAREEPDGVFWATVAATLTAATAGVWAVASWGITGAIIGTILSSGVQIGVMIWLLWRAPSRVVASS